MKMRNAAQLTSGTSMKQQKRGMTALLWTIQGLLALLFLFTGSMKLIVPIQVLLAQMPIPLPALFVRFIGSSPKKVSLLA
jgi:hypothetical protein